MNHDNIISAVPRISVVTQKSQKTGNDYTQLQVRLRLFLNDEQKMLIKHAVESRKPANDMLDEQE